MTSPEDQRTSRRYGLAQSALLCAYAAVVLLDRSAPLFASAWTFAAGSVLCAAGVAVMFSAFASIREAVQISPEPKPGSRLATTGIYRFLRHPIYTAIIVMTIGLFLRRLTLPAGVGGAVVVAFLLVKVRFEEKRLLAVYPEYAEYKRRVCGVLPGW